MAQSKSGEKKSNSANLGFEETLFFNAEFIPLLQAAQARVCFVMDGLAMLLYQGTLVSELWTGKDAPVEVMRDALGLK